MTAIVQRFAVSAFFRWYDLWIGAYWDRDAKVLYVCPVPMFGIKIKMPWRREAPIRCNCRDWLPDRPETHHCPVCDAAGQAPGPDPEAK
jgi:hypothetical protein